MNKFVWILSLIAISSSLEGAWLTRKAEGWAWYEDKEEKQQKEVDTKPAEIQSAKKLLDTQKVILEEKLAKAMIDPSEENVRDYMITQKRWLDHSSLMANIWEKILLTNPELDPTVSNPVTQYGIQIQKEVQQEERRNFIKGLSKDYGLFFFYEGDSKLSQGLSNVVKYFAGRYSWDVIAISMDGSLLDGFKTTKLDNGISHKLGIKIFPALFLVNPQDKTAIPIAYGLVSVDQIEENIITQFKQHQQVGINE